MLHIYKAGGAWKKEDGTEYTIKAIESSRKAEHLKDGWVTSLDDVEAVKAKAKAKSKSE